MKLRAWDKKRECWIPPEDFAVTGTGKILIAFDLNANCFRPVAELRAGWSESSEVKTEDVELHCDEA